MFDHYLTFQLTCLLGINDMFLLKYAHNGLCSIGVNLHMPHNLLITQMDTKQNCGHKKLLNAAIQKLLNTATVKCRSTSALPHIIVYFFFEVCYIHLQTSCTNDAIFKYVYLFCVP